MEIPFNLILWDLIVALDAHQSKCFHLGLDKNMSKSSLARANQDIDCRIFEEYAYFLVSEALLKNEKQTSSNSEESSMLSIQKPLIYALQSSGGQNFVRRKWHQIQTRYDMGTQIQTFIHITEASVYDSNEMKEISCESGSY